MFVSITFRAISIDETNKTAESQRLKIYVQNVLHSREHMHSLAKLHVHEKLFLKIRQYL